MKRCAQPTRTARQPWGKAPLSFPRCITRADAAASIPFWIAGGGAVNVAAGGGDGGALDSSASDTEGWGGRGGGGSGRPSYGAFPPYSASAGPARRARRN